MAYNIVVTDQFVTNGDMSANITSDAIETKLQDDIGLQLNWTGSPVGTFSVQISSDHIEDSFGNVLNPGQWTTVPLSSVITAAGSGDTAYIDLTQLPSPWLRLLYSATSGTGVLNAFTSAKGI